MTGILAVWDEFEGSQTWTRPFPEMLTPRYLPSVISYQKWLVVAGGKTRSSYSNKVEILRTVVAIKDHRYLINVQKCLQPSMET